MSEIVQLWLQRRFPEEYGPEAIAKNGEKLDELLKDSGMPEKDDYEAYRKMEEAAFDFYVKQLEEEYDTAILEVFDLDVRSLWLLTREPGHQKRVRDKKKEITDQFIPMAIEEFIAAETRGLNYTETWIQARDKILKETGHDLDSRTVKKWLNEIAGRSWSTIPAARKGRPCK